MMIHSKDSSFIFTKRQILPDNPDNEISYNLAPVQFSRTVKPFIPFVSNLHWTASETNQLKALLFNSDPYAENYVEISFKSVKNLRNAVLHFISFQIVFLILAQLL